MKKYLITFLLLVSSLIVKSQTCSLDYINIRYGVDKTLKECSFVCNNIGIQVGRFFSDSWSAELNLKKGIKFNGMDNFSVGTNLVYQYSSDSNIIPFVKFGGSYKKYSFDDVVKENDVCQCFDSEIGVGVNLPINSLMFLNFGVNYHHIFVGSKWNEINNDNLETEIGICILLY